MVYIRYGQAVPELWPTTALVTAKLVSTDGGHPIQAGTDTSKTASALVFSFLNNWVYDMYAFLESDAENKIPFTP